MSWDRADALDLVLTMLFTHSKSTENVITELVDFTFPLIRISGRFKSDKGLRKTSWAGLQISSVTVCLAARFLHIGPSRWPTADKPSDRLGFSSQPEENRGLFFFFFFFFFLLMYKISSVFLSLFKCINREHSQPQVQPPPLVLSESLYVSTGGSADIFQTTFFGFLFCTESFWVVFCFTYVTKVLEVMNYDLLIK